MDSSKWIPVEERVPENDNYILLSFFNYPVPTVGRYELDPIDGSGAFYVGDDMAPCIICDLYVNAWMPLPKCYEEES